MPKIEEILLDSAVQEAHQVDAEVTLPDQKATEDRVVFERTNRDASGTVISLRLKVKEVFIPASEQLIENATPPKSTNLHIYWKAVPDEHLKSTIETYIQNNNLTPKQWQNTKWLDSNGHSSFYKGMRKRFQRWESFLVFMGVANLDREKIPEVELKAEIDQYIKNHDLSNEQWQNSAWLVKNGYSSFYKGMRKRFERWESFLVFMGVVNLDWEKIPEVELKAEIDQYIKNHDLSNEQWQNSAWLVKNGYSSFYKGMRKRFQGWENFLVFMRVKLDWEKIPEVELKAEIDQYIKNHDLSDEQWQKSQWLGENGYKSFYGAMRKRFQRWESFLVFMGVTKLDWEKIPEVELKAEIDQYIKNHDLSDEQWQKSQWLGKSGHSAFYIAMRKRFEGWENFLVFMGVTKLYWHEIPEADLKAEIEAYIHTHALTPEQWQNSSWLSRNGHDIFYKAIRNRFEGWENFKKFIGANHEDSIKWHSIPDERLKTVLKLYIEKYGLLDEQWQNSGWTQKNGHLSFYRAMFKRFYSWDNFLEFMGVGRENRINRLTDLLENPSTPEDEEKVEEYKNIVSTLGENILLQFILATNPELQAKSKQVQLTLKKWIGKTSTKKSDVPVIADVPEAVFLQVPEAKELAFILLREAYFAHFEQKQESGLDQIEELIYQQPTETHRAIYQRLWEYYVDILGSVGASNIRLTPTLHQKMGTYEIETKKRFMIADDVGTGKTLIAIEAKEKTEEKRRQKALEQNEKYQRKQALVLCPSEMVETWEKRLSSGEGGYFKSRHCEEESGVVAPGDDEAISNVANRKAEIASSYLRPESLTHSTLLAMTDTPTVVTVNGTKNSAVLEQADYIVMNYDKLDPDTVDMLMQMDNIDYLVLDEAHNIKNMDGKWSQHVRKLSLEHLGIKDGYTVMLSATPLPNKIHEDLPVMLQMLQPENYPDLKLLKKQINQSNGMRIRSILMHSILRHTQTEVLHNLPNLFDPLINGNKDLLRHDLYREERSMYADLQADESLAGAQKLTRLNQASLDPYFIDPEITESSKYDTLRKQLRADLSETDNVVIFVSHFRDGITRDFKGEENDMHLFAKLQREPDFQNVNFYRIDGKAGKSGECRELSRENILHTVRNSSKRTKNVILATIDTANEGIDMTFASRVIFPNLPYTKAAYHQALGRMYRPGQIEDVHCSVLLANNTTEEGNFVYIKAKDIFIQEVMDGKLISDEQWEEISRDFKTSTNSVLSFMAKTDHQKLLWLWGNMTGRGAEHLTDFFERYGGLYGKVFVELYMSTFNTSYGGSNFRFLCNNILKPLFQERPDLQKIADLGSGPLALASYLGTFHPDKEIHALDLNPFAIEAGKKNLEDKNIPFNGTAEVGSFTNTNFENGSQDMAICSLAFSATHHPNQGKEIDDSERATTLLEFNRILRKGGVLVLLEKKSILQDHELKQFAEELKNFGFRIIPNLTGRGHCTDADENGSTKEFENISIVCEKIDEPALYQINLDHLSFTKKTKKITSSGSAKAPPTVSKPKEYKHNRFEIQSLFEEDSGQLPSLPEKKHDQQEQEKLQAEQERIEQLLLEKIQIVAVDQCGLEKMIRDIRELGGKIVKTRNKSGAKDYQVWFHHKYLGNLEVPIKN